MYLIGFRAHKMFASEFLSRILSPEINTHTRCVLIQKTQFFKETAATSLLIWPRPSTIDRVVIYDANNFARRGGEKKTTEQYNCENKKIKKHEPNRKTARVKTAFLHYYNTYICMYLYAYLYIYNTPTEHKRLLQLQQ